MGWQAPKAVGSLGLTLWLIAAFLTEWAKKVDWKQGGTAARPAGKPPKAPITALEAYVQYLRSQAVKSVRSHAPDKEEQHLSVAILKVTLSAAHHSDLPLGHLVCTLTSLPLST